MDVNEYTRYLLNKCYSLNLNFINAQHAQSVNFTVGFLLYSLHNNAVLFISELAQHRSMLLIQYFDSFYSVV